MIMFLLAALGGLAAWKGLVSPTGVAIPPVGIDTGQSLRSRPGSGDALYGRGGSVTQPSGRTPSNSVFGIQNPPAGYEMPQGIHPLLSSLVHRNPVTHLKNPATDIPHSHLMLPPAIPAPLISPARPVSPGSI